MPAAAARSASASAARSSSASAWLDEHERRVGQAHAAAGALEQPHAGLALEHRELLRDGRRRELQRVGDRGDRPALVQLAQQAQAAEVEHCAATLPNLVQKSESILMLRAATMRAMRSSGTLLCLGSGAAFGAMAIFGKLAYGEGATVGTLLAVRFVLAAALFWALVLAGGGAREVRALGGRDIGTGLALGGVRLRAPGRLLLRGAGAHRRFAAVAAALHVPGDRRRRRGRAGPRAHRRAAPGCAGARVRRPRARRGRRRGGHARSARRRARARRRGRLQHLHPRQRRHRRARAAARALGARVHRRGGVPDRRLGAARRVASRRADAGRLGLAGLPRRRLDGRRDQPLLRRPAARRVPRPRRSSPPSSRS